MRSICGSNPPSWGSFGHPCGKPDAEKRGFRQIGCNFSRQLWRRACRSGDFSASNPAIWTKPRRTSPPVLFGATWCGAFKPRPGTGGTAPRRARLGRSLSATGASSEQSVRPFSNGCHDVQWRFPHQGWPTASLDRDPADRHDSQRAQRVQDDRNVDRLLQQRTLHRCKIAQSRGNHA